MKKHIAPPATAEQIQRTIGATREDLEIVDRVMRELGYYEDEDSSSCRGSSSAESSTLHPRVVRKRD
jgi:hypothetical protein